MYTKNFLKVFAGDTELKAYSDGFFLNDIKTVNDYMKNGLLTYTTIKSASIIDGVLTIMTD